MISKRISMLLSSVSLVYLLITWFSFTEGQERQAPRISRIRRTPIPLSTGRPEGGIPPLFKETWTPQEMKIPKEATAPVTLEFKNMDLIDVLKIISDKGKLNIVMGPSVRGKVTLFLEKVRIWDAFELILELNNLAYVPKDNIIKIITEADYEKLYGKKFYDNRRRKIFPLQYARAEDIYRTLSQAKTRIGQIIVDERTNSIVIFDNPEEVKRVGEIISQLDVPVTTQVFKLNYSTPATIEKLIEKFISISGRIETNAQTNKIIVTDIPANIKRVARIVKEYDENPYIITKAFTLNYADPDKIEAKLTKELTKDVGNIEVDKRTNKIIITDLPYKIARMGEIIAALDEKTKEVRIEAKIIQVVLSDNFKMGVNWEYVLSKYDGLNIKQTFNTLADTDPGSRVTVGTIADDKYTGLVEMLKTIGKTNILSNPRITVTDNEEAKILVGSTIPYKTTDTVEDGGVIKTYERVTMVDVGVQLQVTPQINEAGFVSMKIKPEVSSVTEYRNNVPVVETSQTETNIMVKDGTTIVIAGLIKDEEIKTVNKFPLLGDIPLLGSIFFKKTNKELKKTELVIFLTPYIISGDMQTKERVKGPLLRLQSDYQD